MIDQEMKAEIDLMEDNRRMKDQISQQKHILQSYRSDIEQFRKIYTQNKVEEILEENRRMKVNI